MAGESGPLPTGLRNLDVQALAINPTTPATIKLTVALGTTITNQGTVHYDADGNGTRFSTAVAYRPPPVLSP
jgi:uncharacterized membrane protein